MWSRPGNRGSQRGLCPALNILSSKRLKPIRLQCPLLKLMIGVTLYTSLSSTQQAVLEKGECPHCHSTGTVRERWTRNGPTVACDSCGKKVYRPRGRAAAAGHGLDGGSGGHSADVQGSASQSSND